jgi:uncharacterized membrane protein YfhO
VPNEIAALAAIDVTAPGGDSVVVTRHDPGRVSIRSLAAAHRFLVLSDNFVAGWRATVDGQPAAIVRANLAFQGVAVSPGAHDVEFVYDPPAVRVGLWLTIITWAALLAFIASGLARERRVASAVKGGLPELAR